MTAYLVRFEGMNLDRSVYDTSDLSTVRGAGLALLKAPRWFAEWSAGELGVHLEPITGGASAGVFRFESDEEPADLEEAFGRFGKEFRHEFESALDPKGTRHRRQLELRHFTFMVTVVPETAQPGGFVRDREALLARSRWAQLAAPSVAVPSESASQPCAIDGVRPATAARTVIKGDREVRVSESVFQRRELGRALKQGFYAEELRAAGREIELPPFSQELDSLTSRPGHPLHHKMAVIYIDGNGFGRLQERLCRDVPTQRRWDELLQAERRKVLAEIVSEAAVEGSSFREGRQFDGPIRFETLLWGGDELLWVVPAWRGWWTLGRFFSLASRWRWDDGTVLTHAAGLVFCHHGAPIQRIRRLAEELAGEAKADRTRNLFAYQVLESFDHLGRDLADLRQTRTPAGETLLLEGTEISGAGDRLDGLRARLPHGKILDLARALVSPAPPAPGIGSRREELKAQITAELSVNERSELAELRAQLGGGAASWLHLAELWQYLVPEEER